MRGGVLHRGFHMVNPGWEREGRAEGLREACAVARAKGTIIATHMFLRPRSRARLYNREGTGRRHRSDGKKMSGACRPVLPLAFSICQIGRVRLTHVRRVRRQQAGGWLRERHTRCTSDASGSAPLVPRATWKIGLPAGAGTNAHTALLS